MKFDMEVELGDDAMQTGFHLAAALNKAAADIAGNWGTEPVLPQSTIYVRDENGNTVGTWGVSA